jgi:hypothetical protein
VEAGIYPLALYPGEPGVVFNGAFLENPSNQLSAMLPADTSFAKYVKVIHVPTAAGGRLLDLVMNADQEKAIGYLG